MCVCVCLNTATMRILLSDASCGDNTDSPTHTESSRCIIKDG